MFLLRILVTVSVILSLTVLSLAADAKPEQIYDGGFGQKGPIKLAIGNGGAGQSGLVKRVSDAFIKHAVKKGAKPFRIAWYKSDTTYTIKYLESGTVDVGITYSEVAEKIAIQQGIATCPSYYIFRDHFYFVGPRRNPANISGDGDILNMFQQLYKAAELGNTDPPARFLARYDKSATSIKDSELWLKIGQVPWAYAYSTWYHVYPAYPLQALNASRILEEYTITDRGTYLSYPKELHADIPVYKRGTDKPGDPLLNPAHLLIGAKSKNPKMSVAFAKYLTSKKGQKVITTFKKYDEYLYTGAPEVKKPIKNPCFDLYRVQNEAYEFSGPSMDVIRQDQEPCHYLNTEDEELDVHSEDAYDDDDDDEYDFVQQEM